MDREIQSSNFDTERAREKEKHRFQGEEDDKQMEEGKLGKC